MEQVIKKYGQYKPAHGEVEVQTIFDREHDHYQFGSVGWHGQKRIRGCVLHLDIKQGKIYKSLPKPDRFSKPVRFLLTDKGRTRRF
ncbi:MAG: hypothetical protein DRR16_05050 [Candidatus Parabeggiatoa sp. nov. 3]|nr:MAG: hypothetical protein DRR00_11410 [Gammaproteobacteria bacterium]RKZ67099.1 MAG: hypothetical protein DRQ99_07605 [Gammaproteobacteria bacterium]RKZ88365.1 MAG: hypothetical protein DRR16_05050 [Gammaproteobacteria bacterium]